MDLGGVDVEWVRSKLTEFVNQTNPTHQSGTPIKMPQCGRPKAIELAEIVRPILRRLYPEWEAENTGTKFDEFKVERDASRRLLARLEHIDEVTAKLGGADQSPRITASSLHHLIWSAAETQWTLGQRHEAVLAAAKAVNSQLQAKVGRRDVSEADLVKQAFSDKAPEVGKPRLRFTAIEDEKTCESMRGGALEFGSGCFRAIRNPVGHLPNAELEMTEQEALERLAALSLLARFIDDAEIETTE
ncbi:TIGR02391 family protein [Mycolicibacter heraklionensis]|uniref:TIGR02391 family protein n=1 Tax=Mycolicibacter heraklionensis TaxID=512402 RepID=UPI0007E942C8|nr:TIGR02391 family protein [Mycolicibacter heraklionensis]OBG39341.1 TIGR02391 family protein [Mycolicibacter heraklionensis]